MKINQVHCISWKCGLTIEEAAAADWLIDGGLKGMNSLTLYVFDQDQYQDGEGGKRGEIGQEADIRFWAEEISSNRGKFTVHDNRQEDLCAIVIGKQEINFAGNPRTAMRIMLMGWMPWADEIELEPNEKLLERVGDDGAEIDLSKFKKRFGKYSEDTVIVYLTVYRGKSVNISLAKLKNNYQFVPKSFYIDDSCESIRVCYRYK